MVKSGRSFEITMFFHSNLIHRATLITIITRPAWAALISERLSPSIVHEGPMPLIQLLLVLVPQDTFLLFEIPSAITLQVVAT